MAVIIGLTLNNTARLTPAPPTVSTLELKGRQASGVYVVLRGRLPDGTYTTLKGKGA